MNKNKRMILMILSLLAVTLACSTFQPTPTAIPTITPAAEPLLIVTLQPDTDTWTEDDLQAAREVIQERLQEAGVTYYSVEIVSGNQIQVEFRSIIEPDTILPLMAKTGRIIFFDSTTPFAPGAAFDPDLVNIILTGADIADLVVAQNNLGGYQLNFTLTDNGAMILADYTRANAGHYLVIALDGKVISSPVIQTPITDGKAVIMGNFTEQEANTLAILIRGGAYPIPLIIVESRTP